MKTSEKIKRILLICSQIKYLSSFILSGSLFFFVSFYFTNLDLIIGNMGLFYAATLIVFQTILSILFGINFSLLLYKFDMISTIDTKDAGCITFGSIIAIIVSGCPLCGVTLASYLGIASLFSILPSFGLELKFVGIVVLLYSINVLIDGLDKCEYTVKNN
jgi:hypothetical protein